MSATRSNSKSGWFVILGTCAVAAIAVAVWLSVQPDWAPDPKPQVFNAEKVRELIGLKNRGIGFLENKEFADAGQTLDQLVQAAPNSEMAVRDLAIARILPLIDKSDAAINRQTKPDQYDQAVADASQAVQRYLKLLPDSPIALLLSAELANHVGDAKLAQQNLEQATMLSPKDAALWYTMYLLSRDSADEPTRQRGKLGLRNAYQAAPKNLWLLKEWLLQQALVH
ncbi:MAG: hypothetical protein ABGZ17_31770, partial [Planctomycetaceae bacterium]